jgi:phosphate transport system substrate-binding protein
MELFQTERRFFNWRNPMKPRLIAAALAANLAAATAAIALDANLPAYQPVSGISGQLKSVGSDTLNNEMELWAKGFEALYPGVTIEIEPHSSARCHVR